MKKLILLCTFFLFAFTAINAKVIYVDSSNTSGTQDGLTWGTAYTNLETAYNSTTLEDEDEFWIAKGTYVNNAPLPLDKSLSFYGGFPSGGSTFVGRDFEVNEVKISNGNREFFQATKDDLHVLLDGLNISTFDSFNRNSLNGANFTISNGSLSNFYEMSISDVMPNSNVFILENVELFNNWGGTFFNPVDSLKLNNVYFHDNPGGFSGEVNNLIITDCRVENNTGSEFFFLADDLNVFEVINTSFNNNSFNNEYFFLDGDYNNVLFDGVTSTNNVYRKLISFNQVVFGASFELLNSTFDTDTLQSLFQSNQIEVTLENNVFKDIYTNGSGSFIGMLGLDDQDYRFSNNIFQNIEFNANLLNLSPIASPFTGYVNLFVDDMTIENCFSNTSSSVVTIDVKNYDINDFSVNDNTVLYQSCLNLKALRSSIIRNSSFKNNSIIGPGVLGWSGNFSLYNFNELSSTSQETELLVDNCSFDSNNYLSGQLLTSDIKNQTYKNCSFTNNEMGYELLKLSPTESLLFENCVFEDSESNTSSASSDEFIEGGTPLNAEYRNCEFKNIETDGDLIYNPASSSVSITNCSFEKVKSLFLLYFPDRQANIDLKSVSITDVDCSAGIMSFYCDTLKVDGLEVVNSKFRFGMETSSSNVKMKDVQFINNKSNYLLEFQGNSNNTELSNFIVLDNKCANELFYFSSNNYLLDNFNCTNNSSSALMDFCGGKFTLTNSIFENNRLGNNLIVSCSGSVTNEIENCSFISAANDTLRFTTVELAGDLKLTNSTFKNFRTRDRGGAISCRRINATNCRFEGNHAEGDGGAIKSSGTANSSLANCQFYNNQSALSGGAFWGMLGSIENCIFKDNKSNGAIIEANFGNLPVTIGNVFDSNISTNRSILHSTSQQISKSVFINNRTPNGSVCEEGGTGGIISNSFFYGNEGDVLSSNAFGGHVYRNNTIVDNVMQRSSNHAEIRNCIFWSNNFVVAQTLLPNRITYSNIQGGYPGEGNTNVNPQFVDPENGDFRLSCTSPLINKGSNEFASAGTDLDGNARIFADTVDMGAYEFQGDPTTVDLVPAPAFSVSNTESCISDELNFVNATPNKEFFTFFWQVEGTDFTSAEINPTFTFIEGGDYEVTLSATNGCGRVVETTETVTINNAFVPKILFPTTVCPGDTVKFTTDADCGSLAWTVTGGSIQNGTANRDTVEVIFSNEGNGENALIELLATGCNAGGVCEKPVTIEIPVVPTALTLVGDTALCEQEQAWYRPENRDFVPGVLYEWSVVNGTILSEASGYNLDSVLVEWGTAGAGALQLRTYHEILDCEGGDTLNVTVRPQFSINQPNSLNRICGATSFDFDTDVIGDFTWQIDGGTTAFNALTGEAEWSNLANTHEVVATSTNEFVFCNVTDTLLIELIEKPVIDTIVGDTLAYTGINYPYAATSTSSNINSYSFSTLGGSRRTQNSNKAEIQWFSGVTDYSVSVTARESLNNCVSEPFVLQVRPDLDFEVLGEDTVCVNTGETYSSNFTDLDGAIYRWINSNGDTVSNGTRISPELSFEQTGLQQVVMLVDFKGRSYSVVKNVLVESLEADFNISGANTISPEGGGTFTYIYENVDNLDLDIEVIGATAETQGAQSMEIVWDLDGPYQISIQGSKVGEKCLTERVVFEVEKAPDFIPELVQTGGNLCLNDSVTLSFNADEFTENVEWSINNNAVIGSASNERAVVKWPSTSGEFLVGLSYERFGIKTYEQNFTLSPLPEPEIEEVIICGEREAVLKTVETYAEYQWSLEPEGDLLNSLATETIESPGIYKVEVKDSQGCEGVGTLEVLQAEFPEPKILTRTATSFCPSEIPVSISLETLENPNLSYQWLADGEPILGQTASTYTFGYDRSVPGSATRMGLIITRPGCEDSTFQTINVATSCGTNTGGGGTGGGGTTCTDTIADFTISDCAPFEFIKTAGRSDLTPQWLFGDGTTAFGDTVFHAYEDPDRYTVQMILGCRRPSENFEVALTTKFNVPENVCSKNEVAFDNSLLSLPGTNVISYVWDFGDGETIEGTGNVPAKTLHVFDNGGSYLVNLSVKAENFLGDTCDYFYNQTIRVNEAPDVSFNVLTPDCESATYSFVNTSTQSTQEAQYLWNIEGVDFTGKDASFTYSEFTNEQKEVSLTVTDFIGCSADTTVSIEVKEPVEKLEIEVAGLTNICAGGSVELTAPPSEDTYDWFVNDVSVNLATETFVVTEPGVYKVRYKAPQCFLFSQDLEITSFEPSTTVSQIGTSCVGEQITLALQDFEGGSTVSWFKDDALISESSSVIISNAQLSDAGTYKAVLKENRNPQCEFELPTYDLVINDLPVVPLVNYSETGVCFDSSLTITVNNFEASQTYFINQRENSFSFSSSDTVLTELKRDQNLSVGTTDQNGCVATSAERVIKVNPEVDFNLTTVDEVCRFNAFDIQTNLESSLYTFEWFKTDGSALTETSSTYSSLSSSLSETGAYYAVATTNFNAPVPGCKITSDTASLFVLDGPSKPELLGANAFCEGDQVVLSTTSFGEGSLLWSTGDTLNEITISRGGNYVITVTNDTTQCESKSQIQVTRNSLPNVSFIGTGIYEVCGNERLEFTGLQNVENFQWKLSGFNYGRENQELVPRQSGNYTVELETREGCKAESDTLRITSVPCSKCVVITTADDIGVGSLRDAIYCANQTDGLDFITFEIPGSGTQVISIDSILPEIVEGVIVNGFSQSGDGIYDIEITAGAYNDHLFNFGSGVETSDVIGLTVSGFESAINYEVGAQQNNVSQVLFQNNSQALTFSKFGRENSLNRNSFVGDTAVVFTGNSDALLYQNSFDGQVDAVRFVETNDSRIEENSFNNITAEALSLTSSSRNQVLNNSFSNNSGNTLILRDSSNSNNVEANVFGLDQDRTVSSNNLGVKVRESNFNKLSDNVFASVLDTALSINNSRETVVSGNFFGTDANGTGYDLEGPGLAIDSGAQVSENVFNNSQDYGVVVSEKTTLVGNSFLNNEKGGVKVTGDQVTISQNTFVNKDTTVFAIELVGGANSFKAIPAFTGYNVKEDSLILYGVSAIGDSVELFLNNFSREQALDYITTGFSDGTWSIKVPIGEFYNPLETQYYVATSTDPSGNTSQLSNVYEICPLGVSSVPSSADAVILGELGTPLTLIENPTTENTQVWQKMNGSVWVDIVDGSNGFTYTASGLGVVPDSTNNGNYRVEYTNLCNDSLIFYSGIKRLINVTTIEPTCQEEQTLIGAVGGDTINVELVSTGNRKEGTQVSFLADSIDEVLVRWKGSNILPLDIFTADTIKPLVTCVDTIKINSALEVSSVLEPSDAILDIIENCSLLDSVISKDTFSCADKGLNNVMIEVTDIHGNVGSCVTVVEVIDTNSITITCNTAFVEYEVPDSGRKVLDVASLAEFTYAGCDEVVFELSSAAFSCGDLGLKTIEARAISSTDTASCSILVDVTNNFLPDVYNFLQVVYDSLGGEEWVNKEGWEDACDLADVENMHGVTLENGKLVSLDLANNNLTGLVTGDLFAPFDSLKVLNLSGNVLTGLGSMVSIPSLDTFNLSNTSLSVFPDLSSIPDKEEKVVVVTNQPFTFADVETYYDLSGNPLFQDLILDEVQTIDKLDTLETTEGADTVFSILPAPGSFNLYAWQKWNGTAFVPTTQDESNIVLDNVARADSGLYRLVVTNARARGLEIILQEVFLRVAEVDFCTVNASDLILETAVFFCPNEPRQVTVDAPDLTIDWLVNGVSTTNTSTIEVTEEGELIVHAYDNFKCDLYDTLSLEYEVLPFEPEFLMSSEGIVGETVVVVDISFPELDSVRWDFGNAIVEKDEESYLLEFSNTGVQEVELVSVFGNCSISQTKEINVLPAPAQKIFANPVEIKSMTVSPNPTSGLVVLDARLSIKGVADIYLVDNNGLTVREFRVEKETKKIEKELSLEGLPPGVYVVQLWTNTDVKFRKVILE